MKKQYPIMKNGILVGHAFVERQGMFWRITCKCEVRMQEPLKIIVTSDTKRIDLGMCVSYQDGCGLAVRVSAKEFMTEQASFAMEAVCSETFVPIIPDEPFCAIHKLDSAQFAVRNGQPGVRIID